MRDDGADEPLLAPGQQVSRYRVVERIGAGAMGEVYLAVDDALGRRAAIKVLGTRHERNDTAKQRFLREARAIANLSHPNVITVYEAGHVGKKMRPYYAMELLEGGDTQKLIDEQERLASGIVALIGAQAAAGLGAAAASQIIHRDVKPANLGISSHGVVKVTDFGLAKSVTVDKSLTGKGYVVGTADYIAPEQARGEELDERADVYALGCSMFHLLTGRPPFSSDDDTQVSRYVAVMRAHLAAPIPDPREYAEVDEDLAKLVMRTMAKDRDLRPTFEELAPILHKRAHKLGGDLPRVKNKTFTLPDVVPSSSGDTSASTTMEVRRLPTVSRTGIVVGVLVALAAAAFLLLSGCAAPGKKTTTPPTGNESRTLADLRQLTFGGENAEAYWSFNGAQLSLQARHDGEGCDRIYRMKVGQAPVPVSSGKGATTCAHFQPSGEIIYSSTHLAGDACPPRPDMSKGYVWALYDSYDIFAAGPSGTRRLTEGKGYDAEGTVCGKDGSIVFTSTRDGDIELYRMNADGKNVRRLTNAPGYDGGAFFNRDCTKIVWRASRPKPGRELDDYKGLLAQGLVRPTKLELWTADADGSNPMQITYLGAASFAPFFHPTENWILFSSNYPEPKGREFDIWAVRPDGTGLTRVTYAPGFDGFPHVSPDGKWLAFSSNRATAQGKHDTNVFVARWLGIPAAEPQTAADRIGRDVAWLADPEREGRGMSLRGLEASGAFLESRLMQLGLEPAGDQGSYRDRFPVVTHAEMGPNTRLAIGGAAVKREELSVLGFSAQGRVEGTLVSAGYGIVDQSLGIDDYAGVDAKGKVVLVRRFAPERLTDTGVRARLGDLRRKAFFARERGARALLVVDLPLETNPPPAEAPLLTPTPDGGGDAGIPVMMIKRAVVGQLKPAVAVSLEASLAFTTTQAFNVVGRIPAGRTPRQGTLVIGAHYDHLGLGGRSSLAPDKREPHLGADDNASGTATVLELARLLVARRAELSRDVVIALFTGEETGLLGSQHFTRARPDLLRDTTAMLNLDMVGRLRGNRVEVLGTETATEWNELISTACAGEGVTCAGSSDGFGASDQAAFYGAGIPVLHFFTGTHTDYHRPSDTPDKLNAAGAAAIARVIERVALGLEDRRRLTFKQGAPSLVRGDTRSFNASLGTIPDYAGPPDGTPGVLLTGVRPGGAAELAGMKRGDILVKLGVHEIRSVQDLGFALSAARPGDKVTAVVIRAGQRLALPTTLQEAKGPR